VNDKGEFIAASKSTEAISAASAEDKAVQRAVIDEIAKYTYADKACETLKLPLHFISAPSALELGLSAGDADGSAGGEVMKIKKGCALLFSSIGFCQVENMPLNFDGSDHYLLVLTDSILFTHELLQDFSSHWASPSGIMYTTYWKVMNAGMRLNIWLKNYLYKLHSLSARLHRSLSILYILYLSHIHRFSARNMPIIRRLFLSSTAP
jgi:hypothetical protein